MERARIPLQKIIDVINVTDGQAAGASTVGAVVDVSANERFESLTFVVASGTITTGSFTILLEESTTGAFGGEETTVALADVIVDGAAGETALPAFAVTDDDTVVRFGLISKKDFVRLTLVGASTPVGDFHVIAILDEPKDAPVAAQTV